VIPVSKLCGSVELDSELQHCQTSKVNDQSLFNHIAGCNILLLSYRRVNGLLSRREHRFTAEPVFFACPLCRDFGAFAKITGGSRIIRGSYGQGKSGNFEGVRESQGK